MMFITLATLVWASLATGFVTYYYLEQAKYQDQINEKQQLMNQLTENYDVSTTRRNLLSGDYGVLLGEYQWLSGENYSSLMDEYGELLSNLNANYTSMLNEFHELNTTYGYLSNKFQALNEKNQVSKEEFGSLLDEFYKLFMALTLKESEAFLGKTSEITANLCIDYGNLSIEWHNISISSGTTLFDLTQKVAKVEYSYWQTMEPGHILITSVNNYAKGYWIWYYWNGAKNEWIFGPVGCDAWILNNKGTYKWACSP